jgi:hypothetical protein
MSDMKMLEWFEKHGHPGYKNRVMELQAQLADASYHRMLELNHQIDEVLQEAKDRYDDWASDPLP